MRERKQAPTVADRAKICNFGGDTSRFLKKLARAYDYLTVA